MAAGCTTVQVTSFVHPKAIPQMQDAKEVAQYVLEKYPALRAYALVPNLRGAQNAYEAGLREISYVISVSPGHNMANVRRTLDESFAELGTILATYPDMKVVLDAATTFGCPFDGEVTLQQVMDYVEKAYALGIRDIDLCDTIGVATPVQVENTILALREKIPGHHLRRAHPRHAQHGHGVQPCGAAVRADARLHHGGRALAAARSRPAHTATRPAKTSCVHGGKNGHRDGRRFRKAAADGEISARKGAGQLFRAPDKHSKSRSAPWAEGGFEGNGVLALCPLKKPGTAPGALRLRGPVCPGFLRCGIPPGPAARGTRFPRGGPFGALARAGPGGQAGQRGRARLKNGASKAR